MAILAVYYTTALELSFCITSIYLLAEKPAMEKKKPPNRKLADRMKRLDSLDKSDAFMKNNSFAFIIDNFSIQNTWYPSKMHFEQTV